MRTTLAFLLLATTALAAEREIVTLAWDRSPASDIVTYRVYWGVGSRAYTNHVSVGGTLTNATVIGLAADQTYYFAATAINTGAAESDFSNEVAYRTQVAKPGAPSSLVMIRTTIERSTDLGGWQTVTNYPLAVTGTTNGTAYYRAVMSITPGR